MQPIKRVQIVADRVSLGLVLDVVHAAGASDFTVFRDVQGEGERGRICLVSEGVWVY